MKMHGLQGPVGLAKVAILEPGDGPATIRQRERAISATANLAPAGRAV